MTATVPLAATVEGESGPPVIILHGLLGSARNWQSIATRLAGGRQIHALDLRNHGRSPWAEAMTYEAMAADVARYIGEQGLEAPVVLGHSMGGKVAMVLALTRPEAVGALVVVDVAPVAYRSEFLAWVNAMRAIDLAPLKRRAEVEALLAPTIPNAGARKFLVQNLDNGADGLRWRPNLDALAHGMHAITGFPDLPEGARYDGPTLFLRGERSDYVRPQHRHAIQALFPKAEFQDVPGAGHWVHAENPTDTLARLEAFLKRVETR